MSTSVFLECPDSHVLSNRLQKHHHEKRLLTADLQNFVLPGGQLCEARRGGELRCERAVMGVRSAINTATIATFRQLRRTCIRGITNIEFWGHFPLPFFLVVWPFHVPRIW